MTPEVERIVNVINNRLRALTKKVNSANEILISDGPLSGQSTCCYVFGINRLNGDLYYVDDAGEWQLDTIGGGSAQSLQQTLEIGNTGDLPILLTDDAAKVLVSDSAGDNISTIDPEGFTIQGTSGFTSKIQGSNPGSNIIAQLQASSGTLAYLSDIVSPSGPLTINTQTGDYLFQPSDMDNNTQVIGDSATDIEFTLDDTGDTIPVGTNIMVGAKGAGRVTIVPVGTTILTPNNVASYLTFQNSEGVLIKQASGEWNFSGDIGPAAAAGGLEFVLDATEPDTSKVWIDTNLNYLESYPVRFYVDGAWTEINNTGLWWDNIGKTFSNGRPYVMLVSGQSNPAGPYIGVLPDDSVAPYNSYYGDMTNSPHVTGWNTDANTWVIAQIGQTPFQYASGANYVMQTAKKIAESYGGRSIRIVAYYKGGTALECWSGIDGVPTGGDDCYLAFTTAITDADAVNKADLFIWGHGEGGVAAPATYYDKYMEFIEKLREDTFLKRETIILSVGTGDAFGQALVTSTSGEGGLRRAAANSDIFIDHVDGIGAETDGFHWTPLGHEQLSDRIFARISQMPIDKTKKMLGYDAVSAYKLTDAEQKVVATGLSFTNGTGDSYIKLVNNDVAFRDADPSGAGANAGLFFNRFSGPTGSIQLRDYAGAALSFGSNGFLSWGGNGGFHALEVQAALGSDPTIGLWDTTTNKKWQFRNVNASNNLSTIFDGTTRMRMSPAGGLIIGPSAPELLTTSTFTVDSTTKGVLLPRMTTAQKLALKGILSVTVNNGGTGATNNSPVTFSGGGITEARGLAQSSGGIITSVAITASGTGVTGTVTATQTSGTGASFTVNTGTPEGLIIYDTDLHSLCQYNGTEWETLSSFSGTWTPTVTNVANVDSSTPQSCNYSVVGSIVTFSGTIIVDPTATATGTTVTISLPINSNFTDIYQGAGSGSGIRNLTSGPMMISSVSGDNQLQMDFISFSTSAATFTFSGSYQIIP